MPIEERERRIAEAEALMKDRRSQGGKGGGTQSQQPMTSGGKVGYKKGGSVKCKRDGICVRGKTKGRMV